LRRAPPADDFIYLAHGGRSGGPEHGEDFEFRIGRPGWLRWHLGKVY
jgi:hypothetical protein